MTATTQYTTHPQSAARIESLRQESPSVQPASRLDRVALRADLTARLARAEEYVREAERDGDDDKARRALLRVYLRTVQLAYLDKLPRSYQCPRCLWGDENWPVSNLHLKLDHLWNCPEHYEEIALEKAHELLEAD